MSSTTTTFTSATTSSAETVKHKNTSEKEGISVLSTDDGGEHGAQHLATKITLTASEAIGEGEETPGRTPLTVKSSQECTFSMEWAQLPRMPALPPREEFQPVEKFITDAIQSRHYQPKNDKELLQHKASPASAGYRAILDLLHKKDDLQMLKKVFLALRTHGVERISSERSKHNRLIHYIFRLNPFDPKERGDRHRLLAMNDKNNSDCQARSSVEDTEDFTLGEVFLNFIVALTSANSVFLTPTLNALWRLIIQTDAVTPHDQQLYLSSSFLPQDGRDNTELEKQLLQRQLKINSLLHGSLRKVLQLVPKGNSEIYPVIASSFPFKLAPMSKQVNYMKQSLIVLRYVPSMQRQFLELCVDKCLEIDVEIQVADNGSVKIEEKKNEEDDNDVGDLFGGQSESEEKDNDQTQNHSATWKDQSEEEKVDEMAEKLDTLMYLVFEHLHLLTSSKQKTPSSLFKMLLPSFESVILTTHRCKFIQFLIIFLCGLDTAEDEDSSLSETQDAIVGGTNDPTDDRWEQPKLFREFAAKLIDIVLDPYRATVTRQSAACYLASFVSRTACVNAETACESVSALLRFAEAYMDTYPTEASARNTRRYLGAEASDEQADRVSIHSLFYTISQASFYIMCFRGKECIQYYRRAVEYHQNLEENHDCEVLDYSDPQLIDITPERWNRLCSHHLNPLRFCLESVRGEFLLLADNFDLLDLNLLNKLIIEDRKMESSSMSTIRSPPPSSLKSGVKRMMRKRRKVSSIQTAATLEKRRIAGGVGGLGKGSNPLDSFFPFDPYLLRRSYVFVDPHYRHWNGSSCEVDSKDDSTDGTNKHEVHVEEGKKEIIVENEEYDGSSSDSDSEDENDDDNQDEVEEEEGDLKETAAMSLTSATMSMGGSEWTDDLTDTELNDSDMDTDQNKVQLPEKTWVNELKRARTLSVGDDCW